MIPEPVSKGIAVETATGKRVNAFFLKHHADAGETVADDCYLTTSTTLDVGTHSCGEAGCWPVADFRKQFQFVAK